MSVLAYESYRDSGVEWLPTIPAHWAVAPVKVVAYVEMGQSPSSDDCNLDGFGLPFLQGCAEFGERYPVPIQFCDVARKFAEPDDLLLSVRAPVGAMNLADRRYGIGRGLCAVRGVRIDQRFLVWAMTYGTGQLNAVATGSTYAAVSVQQVAAVAVPIPPSAEQAAIAAFLDRETSKIDALVEEQRRLVELLKEKRQAVISHAVTKGLDPTVPMKDSGVEWLGEVPAHWEVRSISSVSTKITNGYVGPTRDILVEEGVRYLQSLHIKNNQIKFESPYFVSAEWSADHAKSILEVGDTLIVQTGDIGQVAVVTDDFAGCNCHALIIVAPLHSTLVGDWLGLVLNGDYGFHSLLSIQTGALHPHLNCGNVKGVLVPLPPLSEQKEIVSYVRRETGKLDPLVVGAEAAITLLQERRAALISAAVTGKIDVRGLVPDKALAKEAAA